MTQGMQGTGKPGGEAAPLSDVLAFLEASVEALCAVDWAERGADELAEAVSRVEIVARRLESAGARATAELAALHRQKGRSPGGVAAMLAEKLGLARGTVHGRIEAGGRQATPAGRAAASGQITGEHERIIAKAVAGLPGTMGGAAKTAFAEDLTAFARTAAPADLRAEAARRVAALCPDKGKGRDEHQERQRSARLGAVRADGTSTLTMTLTPRGRALVERALCDFGGPGGAVACDPGSDERTPEQRAHDALLHQWALGSTVDPARPKGVASIVVRMTPEQLDDPAALVQTDSGTQLSVRQAVSMAGGMPWFVSLLREGREELHKIEVDAPRPSPGLRYPAVGPLRRPRRVHVPRMHRPGKAKSGPPRARMVPRRTDHGRQQRSRVSRPPRVRRRRARWVDDPRESGQARAVHVAASGDRQAHGCLSALPPGTGRLTDV